MQGLDLINKVISEEMVPHSHVYGYMVISFKVHLPIRTVFGLLERVDALVLHIDIQLEKYKLTASHKWSFNTGGH